MLKKKRINLRSQSKDEESLSEISDISCPEQPEFQPIKSKKPKKKRHKFTHSQDKKMLEYIMNENRYDEIKGLALWKDMETLAITNHSRQSMRCRFLKILLPNLHQYNIPNKWVHKLRRLFPELLPAYADKENEKTNFPCSMLDKWRRQSSRLKSSPRQVANGADKTRGQKSSETSAENKDGDSKEGDSSCDSTEPFTESPVARRKGRKRLCKQPLEFRSSSESDAVEEREPVTKSPITPRRSKRRLSNHSLQSDRSSESDVEREQEPVTKSPITPRRSKRRLSNHSLQSDRSSESDGEREQEPVTKSPITPRRSKRRLSNHSLQSDRSSESDVEREQAPAIESPITPRRGRKRLSKRSLQFDSSSESNAEDGQEKNVSTDGGSGGPSAAISANSSPSKFDEDARKDDDDGAQSELSDYDQYLFGMAAENVSSSKKSPRHGSNVARSDTADTPHEECIPDNEEETDHNGSVSVVEDRRSRLQHRRHIKKVKKAFGDDSSPTTSNLGEFVTNSHPDEIVSENGDEESCSQETECDEVAEYETVISDISKSYGLTECEVLSTIFSFNGDIEKSIAYIRLGPVLSQLEPWTKEEDKIISALDEGNVNPIITKLGKNVVAERLEFLENFSDYMSD